MKRLTQITNHIFATLKSTLFKDFTFIISYGFKYLRLYESPKNDINLDKFIHIQVSGKDFRTFIELSGFLLSDMGARNSIPKSELPADILIGIIPPEYPEFLKIF